MNGEETRRLENIIQAQAGEIEQLKSKGILGFFQRRRLRKMMEAEQLAPRLKEDELRQQNFRLKERVRELENE